MVHGENDLKVEPDLVEPSHMVEDVEAAVDLMLQQESPNTWRTCPPTDRLNI